MIYAYVSISAAVVIAHLVLPTRKLQRFAPSMYVIVAIVASAMVASIVPVGLVVAVPVLAWGTYLGIVCIRPCPSCGKSQPTRQRYLPPPHCEHCGATLSTRV